MATAKDVMKMLTDNEVLFVDLRFTDTRGKEQHVSVPAKAFDEGKFEHGHAFANYFQPQRVKAIAVARGVERCQL